MTANLQPVPDWFDQLWAKHQNELPFVLRNETGKKLARTLLESAIQGMTDYSRGPQGVRTIVAFSKIAAIVKGINGVAGAPDPSPEEVAEVVKRLVEKLKERSV